MANKFVWSGATGLNDGSKWEDAYVLLGRDWGAEAGFTPGTDFVYVRDSHAESDGAAKTIIGTAAQGTNDPVRILCVVGNDTGTTPGNLSTTASVTTTGVNNIILVGKLFIYGADFFSGNDISCGSGEDAFMQLEQCRLELTSGTGTDKIILSGSGADSTYYILLDCDIDFANAGHDIQIAESALLWDGGTLGFNVTALLNHVSSSRSILRNVDLSILSNSIVTEGTNNVFISSIERCKLHASTNLVNATMDNPGQVVTAHLCDDGTDADPSVNLNTIPMIQTFHGQVFQDLARYRTGGASDGVRSAEYSYNMDTATASSNVIEIYEGLESPPIAGWTDGDASTPHTYRIYVASGAVLQDDECWFVLTGPNDAATDSLGLKPPMDASHGLGTRLDPLGTPANLTTDGDSTWNGADVTTKQYMEITYTPDKPGPIVARVYLAKADRVSVDPKIYVDP